MQENTLRKAMLFWNLFIGMDGMLPFFQVLPLSGILFQNFLFPGIALLAVNGIPNFISFYLLKKRKPYGSVTGMCCGILLMGWICIQFYIFPLNFMSSIYFVFGLLEAVTGYLLFLKEKNK